LSCPGVGSSWRAAAAAGTDARPPGLIPSGRGWRFEPKLDGFRCLVCTHAGFRARLRRGWNMTPLLPELADAVPADVQLDGELVALDADGRPDFHRLGDRMLHG
jgi:bifunctional non-homologous end joining protein LigD